MLRRSAMALAPVAVARNYGGGSGGMNSGPSDPGGLWRAARQWPIGPAGNEGGACFISAIWTTNPF